MATTNQNLRITVDEDAIGRLVRSGDVRDALEDMAEPVAAEAKSRAPKRTGAGARSIGVQMHQDGDEWEALVSWDQQHFYMYWHETGSRELPARPFLVPALRAAAQ